MNKREMIIKISDYLDQNGWEDESDFMDSLLKEQTLDIPEDEYDEIKSIMESLRDSLKE